jgi:hypothetical protein
VPNLDLDNHASPLLHQILISDVIPEVPVWNTLAVAQFAKSGGEQLFTPVMADKCTCVCACLELSCLTRHWNGSYFARLISPETKFENETRNLTKHEISSQFWVDDGLP